MRKIKFRGKRKKDGKWVYGYFAKTMKMNKQSTLVPICYITTGEHYYEVDCNTVGMFIGMRDKKNREIYEGDIVAYNGHVLGYIKMNEFVCFVIDLVGEVYGDLYFYDIYPNEIEVVGNIYDNPELLKEVKK